MPDVLLATGRLMPHGAEAETPLLVAALHDRGLSAAIAPWGTDTVAAYRLVVVRTTWDYTDNLVEFLRWLRDTAAVTTVVNPVDIIEWNSHKSYLLDLARSAVPVIPTVLVARGASAPARQAALRGHDGAVVVKPAVSVGANGTKLLPASAAEAAAHLERLTSSGDALVQPYLPAITAGEVSLIYFGGEFSHAVRKTPAAGDFRVQVFHGGVVTPHLATEAELAVGATALAAAPRDLAYARVDLVATDDGPMLMELELIEPQLFLDAAGDPAGRFADHLVASLDS